MTIELEKEFKAELEAAIAAFGLDELSEEQIGNLARHYALLRRWNQRVNLTRIIEPREAAKLHYAESLFGAKFIDGARTVLDIGSGAGFPAVPLAVASAEARVTALEANEKKALFLREAKDELRLDNFDVVNARIEEFDWAGYDVMTSRALDRADWILPSIIERLGSGQRLLLYCASDLVEKLERRPHCKIKTYPIPLSEERVIAAIRSE